MPGVPVEPTVVVAVGRPLRNGSGTAAVVERHDDDETFRRDVSHAGDHVGGGVERPWGLDVAWVAEIHVAATELLPVVRP